MNFSLVSLRWFYFYFGVVHAIVPDYCLQRIGCFNDPFSNNRDLENFIISNTPPITPTSCRDACRGSQYPYAGTQYSSACFCGHDFGAFGSVLDKCDNGMPCNGNQSLRCGEAVVNDIFMTTNQRKIEHLGCFSDGSPPDLSTLISTGGNNTNPHVCADNCRSLGFLFSGLQEATKCSCGNTYNTYGASSECTTPCAVNGMSHCGGAGSNSIYLTGKDDFWQEKAVAFDVNSDINVDQLLDDSETTCIDTAELHSGRDFLLKFSTTAYYRRMSPGITILVTMKNLSCKTEYGKLQVYVYIDNGGTNSNFLGKFVMCKIFEILTEGATMETCVYRCHCVQSSCKEVYVRFMNSTFNGDSKICEIRSCYLF